VATDLHTRALPTAPDELPTWYRLGARIRGVSALLGFVGVVVGLLGALVLAGMPDALVLTLCIGGFVLLTIGLGLTLWPGGPKLDPVALGAPVSGRWIVLNGPADRVPSHGSHGHGQTFALDLVYEPEPGARPEFGEGRGFRDPKDFPAFGEDVLAPVDAVVVAVHDRARDHLTRTTWPAFAYMVLESFAREAAGSRFVLGNHVVLDLGGGRYAALAHLQRGSATVRGGQQVRRGEVIGRCGNSGNSSEPHVHFQVMDHPRALVAAGLPFVFARNGGEGRMPHNDEVIDA
jgi:Peptidase family M23